MRRFMILLGLPLVISGCGLLGDLRTYVVPDATLTYVVPDATLTCEGVERIACEREAVGVLDRLRGLGRTDVRSIRIGPARAFEVCYDTGCAVGDASGVLVATPPPR
jgi:hypothetical protein